MAVLGALRRGRQRCHCEASDRQIVKGPILSAHRPPPAAASRLVAAMLPLSPPFHSQTVGPIPLRAQRCGLLTSLPRRLASCATLPLDQCIGESPLALSALQLVVCVGLAVVRTCTRLVQSEQRRLAGRPHAWPLRLWRDTPKPCVHLSVAPTKATNFAISASGCHSFASAFCSACVKCHTSRRRHGNGLVGLCGK